MLRGYKLTERGKILVALIVVFLLLLTSAILLALRASAGPSPDIKTSENESNTSQPPNTANENDSIHGTTENTPPTTGGDFVPQDGLTPSTSTPSSPSTSTIGDPAVSGNSGNSSTPGPSDSSDSSDLSGNSAADTSAPSDTSGNSAADTHDPFDPSDPLSTDSSAVGNDQSPPPSPGHSGGDPSNGTLSFFFSPSLQSELDLETKSMLQSFLNSTSNTRNNTIIVETPRLTEKNSDILMSAIRSAFTPLGVSGLRLSHTSRSFLPVGEVFEVNLYYTPGTGK